MTHLPIPARPRALLLDFDGVILDSAALKARAFMELYAGAQPQLLAAIADYFDAHGGVTRNAKLAHIERAFFGRSGSDEDVARLAARFRERVFDAVLACPFVPGARELLERAAGRIDLHVVSGTPHAELCEIVERRGLAKWLRTYRGAPPPKREAFADILATHGYLPHEVLAVGDAPTEYEAALALGVPFLAVVPEGGRPLFPPGVPAAMTLAPVARLIGLERA